jgi:cadmium resistance protein CadD (predicted permease)
MARHGFSAISSIWYGGSIAEILPISALAAGAYFATNTDNFLLLAAMLAQGGAQKTQIVLGFGASVLLTLGASYLITLEANLIPLAYLGLLGVVPLALGTKGLVDLLRKGRNPGKTEKAAAPAGRSVIYTSALTLVSNGADTIVVLSALLADSDPDAKLVILLSCVGAAGVVGASSAYAVGHPRLERGMQRIAPALTPFLLLGVGFYILANTATDLLPG